MKFIQSHSGNYASPRGHVIDHIVIHYTGADGGKDTAQNNADYSARAYLDKSAHYYVDENEVVQSVREGDRAFHCGDKPMNDRSIGIEMCSRIDAKGQWYIPNVTVTRTAALVRELMAKYDIQSDNVIRHFDVNGKRCPAPFVDHPEQWAAFKALLREEEKPMDIGKPSAWAKDACEWAVRNGLIVGDGKGNFDWQAPVMREQLAAILKRFKEM